MHNITLFKNNIKNLIKILFFCYLMFLLYILFFISSRVDTYNNVNLKPFATIKLYIDYFDYFGTYNWFLNIFGNILILIPLGIFLPLLWNFFRKWYRLLIIVIPSIMLMEYLQHFFRVGELDIDDVILNTLGALIGYWIYRIVTYFIYKLKHWIILE